MKHDAQARTEAATGPKLSIVDTSACAGGVDLPGGKWARVQGPHLRLAHRRHARNRTGCPGISFGIERGGKRECFYVNLGSSTRCVNITALGREEAWRRALKLRAEHENRIAEVNGAILAAREKAANRLADTFPQSQPSAACPTAPRGRRTSAKPQIQSH